MSNGFVEPTAARHRIELVEGVEQIMVPGRRNWLVTVFLLFWLVMWTFGGLATMLSLTQGASIFSVVWLCFWVVSSAFVLSVLATLLWGVEIIRASNLELQVIKRAGPLHRQWRYRADQVHDLTACPPNIDQWGRHSSQTPVFARNRSGAVKFDYGADTIMLANGVDEAEGRTIAAWLTARLPMSAIASGS